MVDRHRLVHVSSFFPFRRFFDVFCVCQTSYSLTMFLIFFNYIQQVPCRLYLPYDGNLRFQCHRRYSIGILCLWYHLQVWCWFGTCNMIVRALAFVNIFVSFYWFHGTVFWRKRLYIRSLMSSFFYCIFDLDIFSLEQTVDLPNHHREVSCAQEWKRRNSFALKDQLIS